MNTSIIQGRGIVRFGNPLFPIVRWMDSPASNRLSNRINAHLSSSKLRSPDKMPRAISRFITHYPWSVNHEPGSTHIVMSNVVDARSINVSWNIADSFPANFIRASIPFNISVEDKLTPQGMVFRCTTRRGRSYRYVIDGVQCYTSHSERDSVDSYKGPLFESLEPVLQEAFDEVLHSWGVNTDMVDFIEASCQYYNNSEYIRWLLNINDFISSNN